MIQRVRVFAWGGPVPPEVRMGLLAPAARRGLLLAVEAEGGALGLGEAAPLPQLSMDDAGVDQIALARLDWREVAIPRDARELGSLYPQAGGDLLAPAARFAFETALASLAATRAVEPLHRWLVGAAAPPTRAVGRSIYVGPSDDPDTLARAVGKARAGAATLKIKHAKSTPLPAMDALLAELRSAVGPRVSLRVDENGQLSSEQALEAARVYARHGVELLEEPCPPAEMGRLGPLAVPVFADECLADFRLRPRVLLNPSICGLVLKPTLLGGITETLTLAREAPSFGKAAIVTHAFEGPVALAACAELALAIAGPYAHGLDDHAAIAAFRDWPVPQLGGAFSHVEPARLRGLGLGVPSLEGLEEVWRWTR